MKAPLFFFLSAVFLTACGKTEIDKKDELDTAYELVVVDSTQSGSSARRDSVETEEGRETTPGGVKATRREEERGKEERKDPGGMVVFDPDGDFTIQVGVYKDPRKAGRIVRELSAAGYPAYALEEPEHKGVRVRIGYFKTREDAQRFGRIFKKDRGGDFWVDSRKNERF